MDITKKLTLTRVKQLIDLNEDLKNFEVQFSVVSDNQAPFLATVIDQTILDNTDNFSYQTVENGTITGEVKHDKNTYQNHYLLLKADNPCVVTVNIRRRQIAGETPPLPQPIVQQAPPELVPDGASQAGDSQDNTSIWKTLFILLGVGLFIYGMYKIFCDSPKKDTPSPSAPVAFNRPIVTRNYTPNPLGVGGVRSGISAGHSQLDSRLKNLDIE